MSKETFQIVYDGEALSSGFMDVYELAPALLSVGDLVKSTNAILNGRDSSASVLVESDFNRGSFEISLILDQIPAIATLLPGHEAIGAAGLVSLIFGAVTKQKEIIGSLLELWKKLKGEKPKEIIHNESTANFNCDWRRQQDKRCSRAWTIVRGRKGEAIGCKNPGSRWQNWDFQI